MTVGAGGGNREDATPNHDEVVDPRGQGDGDLGRRLGNDAGPRRQLVARQPQPDQAATHAGPHRVQHLTSEAQPVGAVVVVAQVGQPRQELAHQAVLAGIDLDPVESAAHGQIGGGTEAPHDGLDLVMLHDLGHLAGVDLGHAAGRPQRTLAVGRRSLSAGVADSGDGQRPMGVHPIGQRRPAGAAVGGERTTLVGPIRFVDRCLFADHQAGATGRTTLVVRQVPFADRPIKAEIRLVGTEQHPIGRLAITQRQRFEHLHPLSFTRRSACSPIWRAQSATTSDPTWRRWGSWRRRCRPAPPRHGPSRIQGRDRRAVVQ